MVIQAAFFYNGHASENYILPDYSQIVYGMQEQIGSHCWNRSSQQSESWNTDRTEQAEDFSEHGILPDKQW